MIFSSVPVYLVFISWKNKPKCFQKLVAATTHLLQKLCMVVRPQKK